ncbi:marine proteobacterial sortase target protein [Sphingomonas rosea]|uniref:Marine proteobacterial sortase target protein n=2 Tax=Sphingomonas rosea TaxID=335605 RepID=A0ABP7U3A4_9SPHN
MNAAAKLLAASALATVALTVAASGPLLAQDAVEEADDGPGAGMVLLRGKDGSSTPAIQLGTDMQVAVSGTIARVKVTQAFRNTSDRWVEASYLYPLPENGAVDSLRMVVGKRVIIGKIKTREDASATYDKAKEEGRAASLVEQQRPNLFTNKVANVGPGQTIVVEIEYQAPVRQVGGTYSLRLPLVAGPRYVPPHTLTSAKAVDDAVAVTSAPIARREAGKMLNPVSIGVSLAPGFTPTWVTSPYHKISVAGDGAVRRVSLATGPVAADRDFELSWKAAASEPSVGTFTQDLGGEKYLMATIVPPVTQALSVRPREMVFVIDNSGSMGGSSMDEAKASLEHALKTLRPQDHFNVIRFDDTMTKLFDSSVKATPDQVATAIRFARGLEAEGGTEMLPALQAALADAAAVGDASTVRQIIFLTDGDISNEAEMAKAIAADGGRSHVFPVGIGSAPNSYLMARMAGMGRGTYTNIGNAAEVTPKMSALLDSLRYPAVADLKVRTEGGAMALTPAMLPDLYAGQSLVLLGKGKAMPGKLVVTGRIGDRPWSSTVDLSAAVPSQAVAKLWARQKIDDVETARTLGDLDDEKADAQIEALGLAHSIVTARTSLVAEEEKRSRPDDQPLTREELPINLPAGWDWDELFGGEAAKAALASPAGAAAVGEAGAAVELPQTAANWWAPMRGGLGIALLGLIGLVVSRRRKVAR